MNETKKVIKKCKRYAARLQSTKGVICSDKPGSNIILCNVGQATGLIKDDIINLLNILPSVKLKKFIAEKGESYSYLVFDSEASALTFYHNYNGRKCCNNDTYLYMCFVENVPNTEIICAQKDPEGLCIIEDFISKEEEEKLIEVFDWENEKPNLKNRQVRHFGYEFRYGSNDVDLDAPLSDKIPKDCNIFWTRLKKYDINLEPPDQLTVNKYIPGQGIPLHVDRHSPFGSTILSVSLGSSVVMDWRHHSGLNIPIDIPPRSMLIMQGAARYDWQHGIQPRTWDPIIDHRILEDGQRIKVVTSETRNRETRISLTFRWTRCGDCDCVYKTLCDTADVTSTSDLNDNVASNLEELHVHQVYEQISRHFSSTRHQAWPQVVGFVRDSPPGAVLLDLGAGNGKNILKRNDILQPAADCIRLDLLHAGIRDGCADVIICIAVIHHFSSQSRRIQAVATIARLLRSGGRALITVWAKDQTKSNYLCKKKENVIHNNSTVEVAGINLPVHENRTQFQHKDLLVPWKLRGVKEDKLADKPESTLLRFYHVFEEGELEQLCVSSELIVEKSFYDEGNWCVVCKKV
ncbi:Alkylated DNA repair protein alkB-like 8 [Papilio xuthus]|uniref:Alkylated DNA repair protein alkB-like 8 n=1 Tax=Papilio xuthus TaxID=66420 RepID=A0A194Q7R7_PAPXU|nr:Alkylated DNA repair protein alkB-like 8 [Papilio xuthus]